MIVSFGKASCIGNACVEEPLNKRVTRTLYGMGPQLGSRWRRQLHTFCPLQGKALEEDAQQLPIAFHREVARMCELLCILLLVASVRRHLARRNIFGTIFLVGVNPVKRCSGSGWCADWLFTPSVCALRGFVPSLMK